MSNLEVYVDVLDHIVAAAGEWPDGRPKQVVEHHKGDQPDLSDVPQDRIDVLTELGAIGPPGQGPAAAFVPAVETPAEPQKAAGATKQQS